ncbi:hypothetical protein GGU45_003321 [Niabella hirudinis]
MKKELITELLQKFEAACYEVKGVPFGKLRAGDFGL